MKFTTRIPMIRMIAIRRYLLRGDKFNAFTLAAELETTTKTIYRDINFMRDFLGYEINWDQSQLSYVGSPPPNTVL